MKYDSNIGHRIKDEAVGGTNHLGALVDEA